MLGGHCGLSVNVQVLVVPLVGLHVAYNTGMLAHIYL